MNHNLTISQGDTWSQTFRWLTCDGTPVDLSQAAATFEVRLYNSSDKKVFTLSSADGKIALDGLGNITVFLTASQTAALNFNYAIYHLSILVNGSQVRLAQGSIRLLKDFTTTDSDEDGELDFSDSDNSGLLAIIF